MDAILKFLKRLPGPGALIGARVTIGDRTAAGRPVSWKLDSIERVEEAVALANVVIIDRPPLYDRDPAARYCAWCMERLLVGYSARAGLRPGHCPTHGPEAPILHSEANVRDRYANGRPNRTNVPAPMAAPAQDPIELKGTDPSQPQTPSGGQTPPQVVSPYSPQTHMLTSSSRPLCGRTTGMFIATPYWGEVSCESCKIIGRAPCSAPPSSSAVIFTVPRSGGDGSGPPPGDQATPTASKHFAEVLGVETACGLSRRSDSFEIAWSVGGGDLSGLQAPPAGISHHPSPDCPGAPEEGSRDRAGTAAAWRRPPRSPRED